MSYWAKDMKDANGLFTNFVTTITRGLKGKLISTELENSEIAKIFDTYAGIDALHIWNGYVRGVAVRVQWEKENYRSWTIRYRRASGAVTEYEKRLAAIRANNGWLYPYLTIQVYATRRKDGTLRSFGVVRTKDLFEYIESHVNDPTWFNGHKRVCPEGNTFIFVYFAELFKAGLPCMIQDFESDNPRTLIRTHTNGTHT